MIDDKHNINQRAKLADQCHCLKKEIKQLKEDKSLLDRMLTEVNTDAINMEQKLYNLKDRYLNQNKKHFDELCGEYFDD